MRCRLAGAVALSVACSACGILTHARPTPRHGFAVEASAGGPLVNIGAPIPLPLTTVGASYGVDDGLDVQVHTHLTTAAALSVAGFDAGGTWMPVEQRRARPAVALTGRLYAFTDFRTGTLGYGELSATASWLLGRRFLTYVTVGGLVEFLDGYVHWSPGLGEQVQFGRFALGLDLRWYDPGYTTRYASANWAGLGGLGALGLVLGASYTFGGDAPGHAR